MDTPPAPLLPHAAWTRIAQATDGREIARCYRCGKKLADYYPHGVGDAAAEMAATFGAEFAASAIYLVEGFQLDSDGVFRKHGSRATAYGFGWHRAIRHSHRAALSSRDLDWQGQPEVYPRGDGGGVQAMRANLKSDYPHVVMCHAQGCGARQLVTHAMVR